MSYSGVCEALIELLVKQPADALVQQCFWGCLFQTNAQ